MLKILLVDDEPLVRNALKKLIDSQNLATQIVGEAANGKQALEMAKELKPNVIFLDIRMPQMDGLVSAQEIKRFLPDCSFVILSAYDEFEYARKAIDVGVYRFLLKPVEPDQIRHVLEELLKIKSSEGHSQRTSNRSLVLQAEKKGIARYLTDYILGKKVIDTADKFQMLISEPDYPVQAALIETDGEMTGWTEDCSQALLEKLQEHFPIWWLERIGKSSFLILLNQSLTEQVKSSAEAGKLCLQLGKEIGMPCRMGVGLAYFNPMMLRDSFYEAELSLRCSDALIVYYATFFSTGNQPLEISNKREIVRQAIIFMVQNCWDKNITLQSIADIVHLSIYYFSRIFRELTGKKFSDCLLELRLKKARLLLLTTNLPVETIAAECGFNSQSYFGQLFKKETCFTPQDYRRKFFYSAKN